MEGNDAGVEEEGQFERAGGFKKAHGIGPAIGGFTTSW